jgi:hypothetical protein
MGLGTSGYNLGTENEVTSQPLPGARRFKAARVTLPKRAPGELQRCGSDNPNRVSLDLSLASADNPAVRVRSRVARLAGVP